MSEIDATLPGVSPGQTTSKRAGSAERAAVQELVRAARARGEDLTGPDGLLKTITKSVLGSGLGQEASEHLGYDKHAAEGRNGGNSRNGNRTKTCCPTTPGRCGSRCRGTG